ncbi:hypothetical protein [Falsiroseomonas tokyonensis]|uniref:Uncharacterized protein n=1 Tax=Falsiroseomonas tokyonensis TaxID=430521 RepID=A0ABV7C3Y6_9PROT|nr:hypothetical protein [Falsiroseomonas tokyonensis]MBU8541012.1 hypothetical protein [Falsiroseomonas tokyonensis]
MVLTWLRQRLRAAPSDDPRALDVFLERQAAFVTQKTVIDYCRVKAGRSERQTFADPDFQAALNHCRWQTFPAAVQDVAALAEAWLRPHAGGAEPRLAEALARIAADILARAEAPEAERAAIAAEAALLPARLAARQESPPATADRLPLAAEAPLLATLPIHPDQRIGETPAIRGALRFHIVATQQEMERAFDPAGLARNLAAVLLRSP